MCSRQQHGRVKIRAAAFGLTFGMDANGAKKKQKAEGLRGKKKQKVEKDATPLASPISIALFTAESINRLKDEHDRNEPYKHIVFNNLCDANRMRLIHEEAKNNMTATFKETDLFKVPNEIFLSDFFLMKIQRQPTSRSEILEALSRLAIGIMLHRLTTCSPFSCLLLTREKNGIRIVGKEL
jgi:hypothetical protein